MEKKDKGRGRPLGFKLTEASKRAISESKKGQRHSEETKQKISKTLMLYFKLQHPLSKEFIDDYGDIIEGNEDVKEWFENIKDDLDSSEDILTERSINSKRLREFSIEYNMEIANSCNVSNYTVGPSIMYEIKELCEKHNINFEEFKYSLDLKFIKKLLG